MGQYDTSEPAHLPVPARARALRTTSIADHFFQARVRWLVPQPPVARRGADAGRRRPARPAGRPALGAGRERLPQRSYPLYTRRPGRSGTAALTVACANPAAKADYVLACGDYRGEHDPAGHTPAPPGAGCRPMPAHRRRRQYPNIGDRLSAQRGHHAGTGTRGGWDDARQPAHPDCHAVPVPPPAVQLLRRLRAGDRRGRRHLQDETEFIASAKNGSAAPGQLRQAVRRRERAPRLRQRAQRLRPPRRPAPGGHDRPAGRETRWSS